jgi:UDP-GlcNAc:undecaprenyl-phosphate/decaprenyl-phosphate GlcNAc-1-phosphate transferase
VLAFGAVALTLFDALAVAWAMGIGLVIALVISAIPRLRETSRS